MRPERPEAEFVIRSRYISSKSFARWMFFNPRLGR